ncbi:GNAT family N-acetyltransferase [Nocardia sp. NPDC049149]|uniref:GNAT family N-acetyltransferase n=1 Tax=Nocardia sp. NPDC049149 TaxID=3364315 RepID=UPI003720F83A
MRLSGWSDALGELVQAAKRFVDKVALAGRQPPHQTAAGLNEIADTFESQDLTGKDAFGHHAAAHASDISTRPEPLVESASATADYGARRERISQVGVRQLSEDDWRLDRELALRSIEDTPWAYRMTYQEAQAHPERYWRNEIGNTFSSTFVAMHDGKPIGQIGTWPTKDRPGVLQLGTIWVAPEARGTGVSDQLMHAQLHWLRDNGHSEAVLWTREDNTFMQDLAGRHGFSRTGNTKLDPGRGVPSIEMGCKFT